MLRNFIRLMLLLILGTIGVAAQTEETETLDLQDFYFYTYHNATGNRIIPGKGDFPNVQVLDVELSGLPAWAIGYAMNTTVWHVVLQNGDLELVEIGVDGLARSVGRQAQWFAPGQPFIVGASLVDGGYIVRGDNTVSSQTHPIPYGETELLYIATNGDVVLARETGAMHRLEINAMRDSRLVVNDSGQIAVLVDPTDQRYVHGIMGDNLEASALVVLEVEGSQLNVVSRIDLPDKDVIEGLSAIWADVDDDGNDELIVTVSNGRMGAQVRAYHVNGTLLASGPAIGQGNRWRHQLAWGAFGPDGENELVDVLTPHIGGVVEFYRYVDGRLDIVEQLPGYTTHVIGSRNLDMGVAGDFNGDGQLEIVVLNQARNQIAGIQHTADGAREVWSLEVGGRVMSNLAAVTLGNGELALAAGTDDGRLRMWIPQ